MEVSRRWWTVGAMRGVVASAAVMLTVACETRAQSTEEAPIPSVGVVLAEHRDIPLETAYTGRVEAVHTVELRPRVGGALEQVLFREGSLVRRGTPLFRIDPRPYSIALRRAEAELATVAAQLVRAREESRRAERLAAADAVAVEELDRRRAEVAMLEGQLDAARAAVQDAALNLEFTTVQAPVTGRVGRAEVMPGNLVNGGTGEGTRLAVLHSTDPVYVYFDLDPATATAAAAQTRAAWRASVSVLDGGGAIQGPIDFVDNGVGPQTGTLRVRARLPNADGRLLPGSVVKVGFRYGTAARATVVPELAIGTDQGARFVFVAAADGTVEYRPITTGARSGSWRVVSDAVRAGDQVILPGMPGLRPGIKVAPVQEVAR
ncbi:MAG: efflux RND transporter periplasmic adaptor subunit [Acidobacteriota bacterium]|nr:efflux RND transporter periplasmic adaptor subunit [Acidobacteriota bacterium]